MILTQRTAGYDKIPLGNGTGSIWNFGCKLVSITQGLRRFNIVYTPTQLNDLLKKEGLFTGTTQNLINDAALPKLPFIESFQRIDSFTMTQLAELLKTCIVVGEVSPKPIGGTGQHFVEVESVEGANAIIADPWFGDLKKVAQRYGDFGNILSLRVYKVMPQAGQGGTTMPEEKKYTEAEMTSVRTERDRNWNWYTSITKMFGVADGSQPEVLINAINSKMQEKKNEGVEEGKKNCPKCPDVPATPSQPAQNSPIDLSKLSLNGVSTKEVVGGVEVTKNYEVKKA